MQPELGSNPLTLLLVACVLTGTLSRRFETGNSVLPRELKIVSDGRETNSRGVNILFKILDEMAFKINNVQFRNTHIPTYTYSERERERERDGGGVVGK